MLDPVTASRTADPPSPSTTSGSTSVVVSPELDKCCQYSPNVNKTSPSPSLATSNPSFSSVSSSFTATKFSARPKDNEGPFVKSGKTHLALKCGAWNETPRPSTYAPQEDYWSDWAELPFKAHKGSELKSPMTEDTPLEAPWAEIRPLNIMRARTAAEHHQRKQPAAGSPHESEPPGVNRNNIGEVMVNLQREVSDTYLDMFVEMPTGTRHRRQSSAQASSGVGPSKVPRSASSPLFVQTRGLRSSDGSFATESPATATTQSDSDHHHEACSIRALAKLLEFESSNTEHELSMQEYPSQTGVAQAAEATTMSGTTAQQANDDGQYRGAPTRLIMPFSGSSKPSASGLARLDTISEVMTGETSPSKAADTSGNVEGQNPPAGCTYDYLHYSVSTGLEEDGSAVTFHDSDSDTNTLEDIQNEYLYGKDTPTQAEAQIANRASSPSSSSVNPSFKAINPASEASKQVRPFKPKHVGRRIHTSIAAPSPPPRTPLPPLPRDFAGGNKPNLAPLKANSSYRLFPLVESAESVEGSPIKSSPSRNFKEPLPEQEEPCKSLAEVRSKTNKAADVVPQRSGKFENRQKAEKLLTSKPAGPKPKRALSDNAPEAMHVAIPAVGGMQGFSFGGHKPKRGAKGSPTDARNSNVSSPRTPNTLNSNSRTGRRSSLGSLSELMHRVSLTGSVSSHGSGRSSRRSIDIPKPVLEDVEPLGPPHPGVKPWEYSSAKSRAEQKDEQQNKEKAKFNWGWKKNKTSAA